MQTLANCLGKNYNSGKHHYQHFLTQNSEMWNAFLVKDKNIENIICIEKNYKENVENISMNKSGKIKKGKTFSVG